MRGFIILGAFLVAGTTFGPSELAAEEGNAGHCEQRTASQVISIVVCPEGLSLEELAEAGRLMCDEREPCGAWIWSDALAAPEVAPENHDGLTQAQVTSAVGVWIEEQSQFISIEEVK